MSPQTRRDRMLIIMAVFSAVIFNGCRRPSVYIDRSYKNPYGHGLVLAVAPFLDQSGSGNLDSMVVTDEFFTELQQIEGFSVVPVNRVLAVMSELGMENGVGSASDAVALAHALKVDGIIVGSVTRYDPYFPPIAGMAVQLYAQSVNSDEAVVEFTDPGELARQGKTFSMGNSEPLRPASTVVRMFDAGHDDVVIRLKDYSQTRRLQKTPLAWKKYTTSRNYIKFVCHEMVGELLGREKRRLNPIE